MQPSYYQGEILSLLKQHKVVKFLHTDSRLANNDIPDSIQKLRCRTMYEALKCTKDINELARKLIDRLKQKSEHYLALHLRYLKVYYIYFTILYVFSVGSQQIVDLKRIF